MIAFRITQEQYIRDLSGTGAKLYGGRWNSKGYPMLYLAQSRALAALEVLVHASHHNLPTNLWLAEIHIPDSAPLIELPISHLPENWKSYPAPPALAAIGDSFLRENKALVMCVPSVVVPDENNLLLNPYHPEMENVKIGKLSPFGWDERYN